MRRLRLLWKLLFWALALGWAAAMFFLAGQNEQESASLSIGVTELILRVFPFLPCTAAELDPVIRKLAHFGVFAVEGFLLGMASMTTFPEKAGGVFAAVFCAAVAALNEYSQTFAEGRSCEARDMLIDFGGAAAGIFAAMLARRLLRRHGNKNLTQQA